MNKALIGLLAFGVAGAAYAQNAQMPAGPTNASPGHILFRQPGPQPAAIDDGHRQADLAQQQLVSGRGGGALQIRAGGLP